MTTISKNKEPRHWTRVKVGGLVLTALSRKEWVEKIKEKCTAPREERDAATIVFSVNGQTLATSHHDPSFAALLRQADALDVDGQPAVIAARLLTKTKLPERVATTDLFHDVAQMAQENGLSFYCLGSTARNIEYAIGEIRKLYPTLLIAGYRNGYFAAEEEASIIAEIVRTKPDVLWVGLGIPKQEAFVLHHREALKSVGWVKTCGGLFDYFSPEVKRAPRWMQKACLEWLFRMFQEPHKFARRYFTTNGLALWLLLTQTHDIEHG